MPKSQNEIVKEGKVDRFCAQDEYRAGWGRAFIPVSYGETALEPGVCV